jgi:hypothetical protein
MKTLQQFKDIVAKENNFCDWLELLKCSTVDMIDEHFTAAAEKYANQSKNIDLSLNVTPKIIVVNGNVNPNLIEEISTLLKDHVGVIISAGNEVIIPPNIENITKSIINEMGKIKVVENEMDI